MAVNQCFIRYLILSSILVLYLSGQEAIITFKSFFEEKDLWEDGAFQFKQQASWLFFLSSMVLFFNNLFACFGMMKNPMHKAALQISNIFNITLAIVFLGIGIYLEVGLQNRIQILDQTTTCKNLPLELQIITWANESTQKALSLFATPACPCYIDPRMSRSLNLMGVQNLTNSTKDSYLPVQSQDCVLYENLQINEIGASFMQFVENQFNCAGMCVQNRYRVFSNVSNVPQSVNKTCKNYIVEYVQSNKSTYVAWSFIFFSILTLNTLGFLVIIQRHSYNNNDFQYTLVQM